MDTEKTDKNVESGETAASNMAGKMSGKEKQVSLQKEADQEKIILTKKTADDVGEDTHLLKGFPTRDVSNLKTYMNLFKALTGPSTMGMPRVIKNGGLISGFFAFLVIGFMNAYCNITMVRCSRILGRRTGKTWFHYEEVVEGSFSSYSPEPRWQRAAKVAKRVSLTMLVLCQFGLMSFYYQIIATTMVKEIKTSFPDVNIPLVIAELAVCACIIPYSLVRNLRLLAWFSTLANILNVGSVLVVLVYAFVHMHPISEVDLVPRDLWTVPLFLGGAVFTVEGIAMVLPIENRASKPDDYMGPYGIVAMATGTNIAMNVAMGFFGYLAFGDNVTGNVLVSLPHMWVFRLVSIAYAAMVFLTFTLQLYQPAEAIFEWWKSRHPGSKFVQDYGSVVVRVSISIITFLFAASIPKPELLMSLVGAVTATPLVFIMPIVAELLLLLSQPKVKDTAEEVTLTEVKSGVSSFVFVKAAFLLTFGVLAFVSGTYTNVRDIVRAF